MVEFPHVECEPGMRFGYPHVCGVPTDAVAGTVLAGQTVQVVAHEYDLPGREWVLVACWFEARHGHLRFRRAWKRWAEQAGQAMWPLNPDYTAIPDPPSRDEINERKQQ